MTKYEELLSEYEGVVNVEERTMINEGLYCDGYIWIKQDLNNHRKACVLAEEIGHHYTSVGDITNLKNIENRNIIRLCLDQCTAVNWFMDNYNGFN